MGNCEIETVDDPSPENVLPPPTMFSTASVFDSREPPTHSLVTFSAAHNYHSCLLKRHRSSLAHMDQYAQECSDADAEADSA